jgi:hypothetical protein
MNKKLGINDRANSQAAINAYISYREENGYRHKARVLISSKGKELYSNILYVCAVTDASNFYMIVEGDTGFTNNFYGRYGFEDQRFNIIRGTLRIQATDIWGNAIELNITGE